jgi:STE24 endopeptidase
MDREAARRYERRRIVLRLVRLAVLVAAAGAMAAAAPQLAAWLAALTAWRWVGLAVGGAAVFAAIEAVMLPLDLYSEFRIEHGFGLSNHTLGSWLVFTAKEWLVGAVIGGIVLAGLYGLLWYGGGLWWVWLWVGWLALSVGLAKLFPVVILPLFYKSEPIDRPGLVERLVGLAAGTRLTIAGVFKLDLSKETKKANAMLTGLSTTRRVYLSDTLLDAFGDDEIGVVFAHELGHHIHGHITKGIALGAAMSTALIAAIAVVLWPYAGAAAPWAEAVGRLPMTVLAATVVAVALSPASNAIMRRFERQSDAAALRLTDDPAAYRTAFERLAEMNLADPDPPRWIEVLFHDHPAISKRLAMAEAYEAQRDERAKDERTNGVPAA